MLHRVTARLSAVLVAAAALLAAPVLDGTAQAFSDTQNTVFEEAVQALADRDIVSGYDADAFRPERPITRDQLAAMVDRAFDLPPAASAGFADTAGNTHASAIDRVAAAGIVVGCEDAAFCPAQHTSRGQLVTIIDRSLPLDAPSEAKFVDSGGTHGDAVERAAAAGIAAGCDASRPTRFCPSDDVTRGQVALFLARALDLVDRAEVRTLADRQAEQDEIVAEEERLREEERQRRQAEANVTSRYPDSVWDDLARCESGGNWSINTGNGYYGGLQFSLQSWRAVGGSGYPHNASREEQIRRGDALQQIQGWGAWPSCSRQLGLR